MIGPHNNTETSIAAAVVAGPKIKRGQETILDALATVSEGYTRDELSVVTGMPTATVCARANELLHLDKIGPRYNSDGTKVKRQTRTGKNAEVLYLR